MAPATMKTSLSLLAALALAGCASSKSAPPVRGEIPVVLAGAQKAPHVLPGDGSSAALAGEVHALDGVLGADLDTPARASNPGMIERGSSAAERYSRDVQAAVTAGAVRPFLKGVGLAKGCQAPAAPRSTV